MTSESGSAHDRRAVLRALGGMSAVALAGCTGNDTGNTDDSGNAQTAGTTGGEENEPTTQTGANTDDSVPKRYETATSLAGKSRDPDSLTPKDAVGYQKTTNGGQGCSGCAHFIPPKGDDEKGACVLVEGRIGSNAWCKLFTPTG